MDGPPLEGRDKGDTLNKLYDLKDCASPRFVRLVGLARDEGLLATILAGQLDTVREHALRLSLILACRVRWEYRTNPPNNGTPAAGIAALWGMPLSDLPHKVSEPS